MSELLETSGTNLVAGQIGSVSRNRVGQFLQKQAFLLGIFPKLGLLNFAAIDLPAYVRTDAFAKH